MTVQERYEFIAAIKGVGQQQKGQGWMMTLDWKLPGSKFDLVLYGQDWEKINGWQVGNSAAISIIRGNLKNSKDGRYTSDFFWELMSIRDPDYSNPPASIEHNSGPSNHPDPLQTRIAWNSAVNNAVHLIASRNWADEVPDWKLVQDFAVWIYDIITAGPPTTTPPEASEMPVEAPPAEEPTQTGQPDKAPGVDYCPIHNAPLLEITGFPGKKGHPFGEEGKRILCYGP